MEDQARQDRIVEEARIFAAEELAPVARQVEKAGGLTRDKIERLAEKGFLTAMFPVEFGGLGLDQTHWGLLSHEIGKACMATKSLLTVHSDIAGETLLRWGTKEQKATWLPEMAKGRKLGAFALSEPNIGSDAKGVTTTFEKKNGKYVINGKKKWITYGHLADFFIVIAAAEGKTTAFLVERGAKGLVTRPIEGMLAGRAIHIAEIDLTDVEVGSEDVLGKEGFGFEYIVNTALDCGRYSVAWTGVSLAEAALEAMVTYARTRSQFGNKLRSFQLIRGAIADATTKVHAAKALCLKAAKHREAKDQDAVIETTLAKYFTSQVAVEVTNVAVQLHGANGLLEEYDVERYMREAKTLEIIEGASQIQQEILASYALNKYYRRAAAP